MVQSLHLPAVLIIDSAPAHRQLIAAVLERAGFQVTVVEDATAAAGLLQRSTFSAVVRELNLAPARRDGAMQELLSTPPDTLRRTVVTTTAAARAKTMIGPGRVFAVVSKPFELDELVDTVRRCAGGSLRGRSSSDADGEALVQLDTVRRFVSTVPSLRRLLGAPVGSVREAALRTEMRRTVGALSAVLDHAAQIEASGTRAAVLRDASAVAALLTTQPPRGHRLSERGH
jgi:DNA-binding NtrC family response regulator